MAAGSGAWLAARAAWSLAGVLHRRTGAAAGRREEQGSADAWARSRGAASLRPERATTSRRPTSTTRPGVPETSARPAGRRAAAQRLRRRPGRRLSHPTRRTP